MNASNRPVPGDVAAREAVERVLFGLARADLTDLLEGARMIEELVRAGYRFTAIAEPSAVAARPVRLRARYDGYCTACGCEIHIDDPVWWVRGHDGVQCVSCGGHA